MAPKKGQSNSATDWTLTASKEELRKFHNNQVQAVCRSKKVLVKEPKYIRASDKQKEKMEVKDAAEAKKRHAKDTAEKKAKAKAEEEAGDRDGDRGEEMGGVRGVGEKGMGMGKGKGKEVGGVGFFARPAGGDADFGGGVFVGGSFGGEASGGAGLGRAPLLGGGTFVGGAFANTYFGGGSGGGMSQAEMRQEIDRRAALAAPGYSRHQQLQALKAEIELEIHDIEEQYAREWELRQQQQQ